MVRIKVAQVIPSAFSSEQATKLNKEIEKSIENGETHIVLDFEKITKFTTLFFNFSTGYFINQYGKEKYDSMFELINLSKLGESSYRHSYENADRDELKSNEINNAILNILKEVIED